jgi:outer membrane lipoprotein-sorting protein
MKPAEDIKKFFQSAGLSTHPDVHERVFEDVLRAHQRGMTNPPAQPAIGRRIMRNPVVRYGIAAVLVLAAVVGFTLFRHTGNTAWAIEQSIQALDKYRAVLMEGQAAESLWREGGSSALRPVRTWAVANADQTAIEKYRDEMDGVHVLTTDGHKTWRYDPQTNRVTIENRPYVGGEYWVGSGFLAQLKQGRDAGILTQWKETTAKDPATGRLRVVLQIAWLAARWNGPRSLRLEFDPETKLLVSLKQWENAQWEDPASIVTQKLTYYESLPDELFEFQIPPGATVQEQ